MSKLTVRVDETSLTAVAIITTECCGAKLYAHLKPTLCPTCGEPLDTPVMEQERNFNSAKFQGTRYWS